MPEPWLTNTHTDLPAIPRQIIHALELTAQDAARWTQTLTPEELHATPHTPSPASPSTCATSPVRLTAS